MSHPDILDQPERLGGPFCGSLFVHLALAAAAVGYAWVGTEKRDWGDPQGGGLGSVVVNPVATIPLPSRSGPVNPVAADTESQVPVAPPKTQPKAKAEPKAKAPEPDAIPIKSPNAKKAPERAAASPPNKWAAQQKYQENQLYSTTGQRASSEMMGVQGGGGVGVGTNSPLGTQFGWYATLLRDQVARNWKTADLPATLQSAPIASIVFTLKRDGTLVPGSVKVSESSGNRAVDISAQRAIMDAAPFPALPPQYSGSEALLELKFQLRR